MNTIKVSDAKDSVMNLLSTLGLEPIHEYEHLGNTILEDSAELTYEVNDARVLLFVTEKEIEIHYGDRDVKVLVGKTKLQRLKEYFEVLTKVNR